MNAMKSSEEGMPYKSYSSGMAFLELTRPLSTRDNFHTPSGVYLVALKIYAAGSLTFCTGDPALDVSVDETTDSEILGLCSSVIAWVLLFVDSCTFMAASYLSCRRFSEA